MARIWFGCLFFLIVVLPLSVYGQDQLLRDYGIEIGVLEPGERNAITDVEGVEIGQVTLRRGDSVRTGVTAILPHGGNLYQEKVPGAIFVGNGYGKLIGVTQVRELGSIETPIVLTNTLDVPTAAGATIDYTLALKGNERFRSVNPVVGETNDGWLNNIRGRYVKKPHVLEALQRADTGFVRQGNVGAGTGTVCFGFKGGIGSASRVLPKPVGGYRVGVLVQTNFGGVLQIKGAPVGEELGQYYMSDYRGQAHEGSCMMVVATSAPVSARNLERMAKRAMLGLARTGGISTNGSGDYVIAFSTNPHVRISRADRQELRSVKVLPNGAMSPLFMATIEATEEAIINSLFAAQTMKGVDGRTIHELPEEKVLKILDQYGYPSPNKTSP